MRRRIFYCVLGFLASAGIVKKTCGQVVKPMLERLPASYTGVRFTNTIKEDDSLNVFNYEYLYNGAGIGVADFNRDGLLDLFFSGNSVPDKLFLNKGDLKFEDVTKAANVKGNGTWSTGVSIVDINADGLPDIYICHSGKFNDPVLLSNELYINQGVDPKTKIPVFKEMSKAYGLDAPGTQSTQAVFFDYDNDGDLDMFLLNHSNHSYNPFLNTRKQRATPDMRFGNRLFRQDKKSDGSVFFTDVTLQSGIINNALNFGLNVSVSDINQDGWPDIYTTSDYTEQDYYYVNNRNGTFSQQLQKSFTHISKYSMGSDIADANNDGLADLITLDMLPEDNHRQKLLRGPDEYDQYHLLLDSGYYHQQMRNMFQLNRGIDEFGNVRFSEIGQLAGISNTDWSWSPLLADFDNDGWKDLMVTNGYLRDYTDLDFLKYTVAAEQIKQAKEGNKNYKTYDLVKKMPSQKLTNYIFQNNHDLTFSNKSDEWGFDQPTVSNSAVYADLDNDGDLDLVIGNNNEPALIYRNNADQIKKNNFLQIQVKGSDANIAALGAKVFVYTGGNKQYFENYPVRGYQSSVTPIINAGLGKSNTVDSLIVYWPGGGSTVQKNIQANQRITVTETALKSPVPVKTEMPKLFSTITDNAGILFVHHENDFIDFKDEPLLPYQLSKMGPALAKGDVNRDGFEDVYIGGAIGQSGVLYVQTREGGFVESKSQPWVADSLSEDVNAVFFDANNDGYNDLYVVSGGNEYDNVSPEYQDRLYVNDGKGQFMRAANALPAMLSSKLAVAAADIDHDGDIDLFIGGYCVPGSYPLAARSYILRNDSKNGVLQFTDVTAEWNKELLNPGMVAAAQWKDLNHDGFPELLIGGDWMPLMLFNNKEGKKLEDISEVSGLAKTNGMWASITAEDIDNDGDIDIVAGNIGENNQFKASLKTPMSLYATDFDDNGRIDAVMCYYIGGKSYPMVSRDELLDQIVSLKKKFLTYKDYADATIEDIFPADKIDKALKRYCNETRSCMFINDGHNAFTMKPLPIEAQFSKVSSIITANIYKNGHRDLLFTGNFFPNRNQLGMDDAGMGCLLRNDGHGTFTTVANQTVNLFINGDVRRSVLVKNARDEQLIISATNNGPVQVLKVNEQ